MIARVAAVAAMVCIASEAHADIPVPAPPSPFYKAITPEQMMELLTASKAREVRLIGGADGKNEVWAETPIGPVEVGFLECHEAPNPCGYILMMRYRNLPLTPAQLAMFNRQAGFAYAFREEGSRDIVIGYPVAIRSGLPRKYILSSFGLMQGLSEVFENFVVTKLHFKPEQLYHHAE